MIHSDVVGGGARTRKQSLAEAEERQHDDGKSAVDDGQSRNRHGGVHRVNVRTKQLEPRAASRFAAFLGSRAWISQGPAAAAVQLLARWLV